jgi:hypothetical protein
VVTSTTTTDLTWRMLWSHTARHVISEVEADSQVELVSAGYGWGLRLKDDTRCALLVHPTGSDRDVGDLSLTVLGYGTQVIPRAGGCYQSYVSQVVDAVEAAAHFYLRTSMAQS